MDLVLAPDQDVQKAAQLVASLEQQAIALTYQELQSRLALNATAIRTLNTRQYDAAEAIDAAQAELQKQEAVFIMESGGDYPRSHLRQWTDKLEATKAKQAHLRNQDARLQALAGVLSRELHHRDQRREHLIRERLNTKHGAQLNAKLDAARVAIAQAIACTAWANPGMSTSDILPLKFVANALQEHRIREATELYAADEHKQAEAEVKADKMYGSQS